MIPSLLLTASLLGLAEVPVPDPVASQAVTVCQQFVQVRLGKMELPDEIKAQPVAKRVGEWLNDGKIKGPEGPLLFACLLRQGKHWELLNFSLWAPQEINSA
ncbi:hypothetical protein [Aeromonas sp. MR16]|uniref:hypothetical protein n=1 Tax=Aeromonas sp. MR16 TaxID=2923420 RepID=UPI001F4BC021|nr:hypothetical protein [Aeromonas sp. MR16]MCH7371140.1 hypothetical protein [Aeromonas sp. MR16]